MTSISLVWQLPLLEDRNGIITGYAVTISLVSGTEIRRISTQYTNLTVTLLSPYSTYECIVAAYTSVGEGPPSNILLIQTQETSMHVITILCHFEFLVFAQTQLALLLTLVELLSTQLTFISTGTLRHQINNLENSESTGLLLVNLRQATHFKSHLRLM